MNLFRRPNQNLDSLLGEFRELLRRCQSGEVPDSYVAFRELLHRLLLLTVLDPNQQFPRIQQVPPRVGEASGAFAIGQPGTFLRLNNGWFLELLYTFVVQPSESARGALKLKTLSSSVQFQRTEDKRTFVFRYDYLRHARDEHPPGHIQINGTLAEDECLPDGTYLEHVHFPTGRVTIEAIIRLLIVQFGLEPNDRGKDIWQTVLHETETKFLDVARHLPSGRREPPDR